MKLAKQVDLTQFEGMTAGPWRILEDGREYDTRLTVMGPQGCVAYANTPTPNDGTDRTAATNARAIAAVPDLIAEVRALRAALTEAASYAAVAAAEATLRSVAEYRADRCLHFRALARGEGEI